MRLIILIIYTSLIYDVGNASIKRHGGISDIIGTQCQPENLELVEYFDGFKKSYNYSRNRSAKEYLEELGAVS
jgi:hypothetical protein